MSYHNPIATEVTGAGIDGVIASIQKGMKSAFPWISKVFHRAYLFQEIDQDGRVKHMVPKCFESGNEYVNVLPNDQLSSQVFFIPTGDELTQDYDPNVSPIINQEMALVFWCDVRSLPGNSSSNYSPSLSAVKKEFMNFINNHDSVLSIQSIIDKSAEDVFQGFTINDQHTHYTMLPFAGMRINFTVKFDYKPC